MIVPRPLLFDSLETSSPTETIYSIQEQQSAKPTLPTTQLLPSGVGSPSPSTPTGFDANRNRCARKTTAPTRAAAGRKASSANALPGAARM